MQCCALHCGRTVREAELACLALESTSQRKVGALGQAGVKTSVQLSFLTLGRPFLESSTGPSRAHQCSPRHREDAEAQRRRSVERGRLVAPAFNAVTTGADCTCSGSRSRSKSFGHRARACLQDMLKGASANSTANRGSTVSQCSSAAGYRARLRRYGICASSSGPRPSRHDLPSASRSFSACDVHESRSSAISLTFA